MDAIEEDFQSQNLGAGVRLFSASRLLIATLIASAILSLVVTILLPESIYNGFAATVFGVSSLVILIFGEFVRRKFQFGMRTLLVMMTLSTIGCIVVYDYHRERLAIQKEIDLILKTGGSVEFENEKLNCGTWSHTKFGSFPESIVTLFPDSYFQDVKKIEVGSVFQEELPHCDYSKFKSVSEISIHSVIEEKATIESIAACRSLKHLYLSMVTLDDEKVKLFSNLENLEILALLDLNAPKDSSHTGDGLKDLAKLKKLKTLTISAMNEISGSDLAHLRCVPDLATVRFIHSEFKEGAIAELSKLSQVKFLDLTDCQIDEKKFRLLGKMPELKSLYVRLANQTLTPDQIPIDFSGNANLTELTCLGHSVDLKSIESLTKLNTVRFDTRSRNLNEIDLTKLTALQALSLDNVGLSEIPLLPQSIQELSLPKNPISDGELRKLTELESLQFLDLSESEIDGTGIEHLPKSLSQVDLYRIKPSDEGLKAILFKSNESRIRIRMGQIKLTKSQIDLVKDTKNSLSILPKK